jgi:pimeloyl-ACP methyl ester carboxylesterase
MRFRSQSFLLTLTLLALLFNVDRAEAASLSFTPSAASMKQECIEKIDIVVDTQGTASNAADAIILFNSSEVEIIDQNTAQAGIQVKIGSAYELYAGNVVNESQGKIYLTAFSVMGNFNDSGLYGSIFFKTKPGVSSTSFSLDFTPGQSIDSNVADSNGNDVLTSVNTGNYTFISSPCIVDTQAPSVTNVVPGNGATGVALNSNVTFHLNDNLSGVDLSSLQVQLHNVNYTQTSGQLAISGLPLDYTVIINPDADFPIATEIVMVIQAKDLVGNLMSPKIFSFNLPVPPPPVALSPESECGNDIVEIGEDCEPPNSLICDSSCRAVVSACTVDTTLSAETQSLLNEVMNNVVENVTETEFIETASTVFYQSAIDWGLFSAPEVVQGIELDQVALNPFVCDDAASAVKTQEQVEIPYTPPEGFEVIQKPFSLNCTGKDYQTTLSIPQNYLDARAVKCVGGACADIEFRSTEVLQCGAKEVYREEKRSAKLAELQVAALERDFDISQFKVEPLDEPQGRKYTVSKFEKAFDYPIHTSLKMLTVPIIVERADRIPVTSSQMIRLSLPLVSDPAVDRSSIQIYAFHAPTKQWILIPSGKIVEGKLLIQQELDFQQYVDDQGRAAFALMGLVCEGGCESKALENVYQPLAGSRAAVIFVHGLGSDPKAWESIIQDIRRTDQPWQAWTYRYPPHLGIGSNGEDFAKSLETYQENFDVIYLVAHSMGGLVSQEALTYATRENVLIPGRFTFLDKVKKVIMIGTPNDAVRSKGPLLTLYQHLVSRERGSLFSLSDTIVQELAADRPQYPKIPGIDYFVIAGNEGFEVDLPFGMQVSSANIFELGTIHDGIVPKVSAQHVGGDYLNLQCNNYWELGANHVDLIDDFSARRIVGQLISRDIGQYFEDQALMGQEQYYVLSDATCLPQDKYFLIGKKTDRELAPDKLNCSCGNGYCGIDEDKVSCPQDCAEFFRKENYPTIMSLLLLILAALFVVAFWKTWKRIKNYFETHSLQSRRKLGWRQRIWNFIVAIGFLGVFAVVISALIALLFVGLFIAFFAKVTGSFTTIASLFPL